MAVFSLAALASELQNDPASMGYAASVASKADGTTSALINAVGVGASFSIFLPTLAATDIQVCLDPTEFATLTSTQLSQLSVLLAGGVVNTSSANVRSIAVAIFSPAGSFPTTRAALAAAVKRQGSRAEVLWGAGVVISHTQVAAALGRGTA